MPGLPAYRKVTSKSPSRPEDLRKRGPLVLDVATRILSGPSGWIALAASEFAVMRLLIEHRMVPREELLASAFPPDTQQPRQPDHALAQRLLRLRTVLETVGVPGDAITCHPKQGYSMGLSREEFRTFTGQGLALLEELLRTHPNRPAVALLNRQSANGATTDKGERSLP